MCFLRYITRKRVQSEPIQVHWCLNRGAKRGFFVSDQPPSLLGDEMEQRQAALAGCTSCICNPAEAYLSAGKKGPADQSAECLVKMQEGVTDATAIL